MLRITALPPVALLFSSAGGAQVVDRQKLLDSHTFWAHRDSAWYKANIHFHRGMTVPTRLGRLAC